jgi:hypothetical protein
MKTYSTREAAAKLGIALVTLQGHVAKRTFAIPPLVKDARAHEKGVRDADGCLRLH